MLWIFLSHLQGFANRSLLGCQACAVTSTQRMSEYEHLLPLCDVHMVKAVDIHKQSERNQPWMVDLMFQYEVSAVMVPLIHGHLHLAVL